MYADLDCAPGAVDQHYWGGGLQTGDVNDQLAPYPATLGTADDCRLLCKATYRCRKWVSWLRDKPELPMTELCEAHQADMWAAAASCGTCTSNVAGQALTITKFRGLLCPPMTTVCCMYLCRCLGAVHAICFPATTLERQLKLALSQDSAYVQVSCLVLQRMLGPGAHARVQCLHSNCVSAGSSFVQSIKQAIPKDLQGHLLLLSLP